MFAVLLPAFQACAAVHVAVVAAVPVRGCAADVYITIIPLLRGLPEIFPA